MDKLIFNFKGSKYIISNIKYTKKKCINFFNLLKRKKNIFYSIYCLIDKKKIHIGNSIILLDHKNKSGEMSILIGDKNFRKEGIGTYVWGKIMKYVLKKYKLRIIISGTMANHKAMIKIFIKNKMKTFTTPKRFFYKQKEVDGIYAYFKNKNI